MRHFLPALEATFRWTKEASANYTQVIASNCNSLYRWGPPFLYSEFGWIKTFLPQREGPILNAGLLLICGFRYSWGGQEPIPHGACLQSKIAMYAFLWESRQWSNPLVLQNWLLGHFLKDRIRTYFHPFQCVLICLWHLLCTAPSVLTSEVEFFYLQSCSPRPQPTSK